MTPNRTIDNQDVIFQFDYEGSISQSPSAAVSTSFQTPGSTTDLTSAISPHDDPFSSEELREHESSVALDAGGKGKGVTKPMPIPPTSIVHDLFDMSLPVDSGFPSSLRESELSSSMASSSSSPSSSPFLGVSPRKDKIIFASSEGQSLLGSLFTQNISQNMSSDNQTQLNAGKGKNKETAPVLPLLNFSGIGFSDQNPWPFTSVPQSPVPGPSSYGSPSPPLPEALCVTESASYAQPARTEVGLNDAVHDVPSRPLIPRRHSLSSFTQHANLSTSSLSMSRIKAKLRSSQTSSNLARKLMFGKRPVAEPIISVSAVQDRESLPHSGKTRSCNGPWYATTRTCDTEPTSAPSFPVISPQPIPSHPNNRLLKVKGRSNSSPLPFSALDFVPIVTTDIFQPLPLYIRNYFDEILPTELRLDILRSIIYLHEQDYERAVNEGRWSVGRASSMRNAWVGKDKGIRELFRLSRVSRSWQALVFDGQLWTDLDLRSFPGLPHSIISRLTAAGSFVRSLNVAGHVHIHPEVFIEMADRMTLTLPGELLPYTQLTSLNLQGCTALTTRALHHLIIRSMSLRELCVRGLAAVTNTTCAIIGTHCPDLVSLNMSRCNNMDAEGIRSLCVTAINNNQHLQLRELRLSGLKHASDSMMRELGKAAPDLTVLDLSYVRQLHNSALEAFIACEYGEDYRGHGVSTIVLAPRDIGREATDSTTKYRRRVTHLRHLSLSYCVLLTDIACSNLVHSVPHLEFLEMAGIGADLKDDGLIRLLETTPSIKRLDLEDAIDITDSLIAAITPLPDIPTSSSDKAAKPQPGHALEQLNISYASNISDGALLALMRGCTRLVTLEADNTRMCASVMREFVRLSQHRKTLNAKIVAVDCRGIGEGIVKELSATTRPRLGWRAHGARKLMYLDARDGVEEDLKIGQDECDESRVVLKTFYSWQTVDAVKSAREKRRKSTMRRSKSGTIITDSDDLIGRTTRWWSPGGRRSGNTSPSDLSADGCRAM